MRQAQHQRGQGGAAVVEMALLLPVALLMLFGIIECSRFFYLRSMAATIASDAVRQASLPGVTDADVVALVVGELNNTSGATPRGYGLGVSPQVTVSPSPRAAGNTVTVTLRYPFTPLLLPQLLGENFFPASITAGASAMVEP